MSHTPSEAARDVLAVVPLIMFAIRSDMRGGRAHALSVPQFRALGFVHRHAGSSLSEVADHIGLTLPAMSRLIDGLVDHQLMRRQSQSADRRRVTLTLTAKGGRLLESALEKTQAALAERLAALSQKDVSAVVSGLRIMQPLFARNEKKAK